MRGLPTARGGNPSTRIVPVSGFAVESRTNPVLIPHDSKQRGGRLEKEGLEEAEAGACSVDTNTSQKIRKKGVSIAK